MLAGGGGALPLQAAGGVCLCLGARGLGGPGAGATRPLLLAGTQAGILEEGEVDEMIAKEFNPVRVGFHGYKEVRLERRGGVCACALCPASARGGPSPDSGWGQCGSVGRKLHSCPLHLAVSSCSSLILPPPILLPPPPLPTFPRCGRVTC